MIKFRSGKLLYKDDTDGLEIHQFKAIRWLNFDGKDIHSAINLSNPDEILLSYMQPMISILAFAHPTKQVCIAGLGGGCLARYLLNHCPHTHIDAIEINPNVTEAARRYFALPSKSKRFRILHKDAAEHVQQTQRHYDVFFCDIYDKNELPKCMRQLDFYTAMRTCLNPQGIAAINLLCKSPLEFLQVINIIRNAFEQQTLCIPTGDNYNIIVFGFNDRDAYKRLPLLAEQGLINKLVFDAEFGLYGDEIHAR